MTHLLLELITGWHQKAGKTAVVHQGELRALPFKIASGKASEVYKLNVGVFAHIVDKVGGLPDRNFPGN